MATVGSVKAKIHGLIDKINATTGEASTQLSPAVDALIAGYGSGGGGGFIDVTELPTENINEEAVYRLTEEKEQEITLWLAASLNGTAISMSFEDYIKANGMDCNITCTVIETLPDVMEAANIDTFTFPCYVLESTGIAYVSLDGTSATAMPFGEGMLDTPGADKGWIDSVDDIVIDTSTDNTSIYTIRPGTQLVEKGVFAYYDGWYELEKTLETTEKPHDPTVYVTTKNGEVVDWLKQLGAETGVKIPFVDALPLDIDGIYVLNATGFVYLVSNGQAVEFTEILSGTNCGWVDSIEEIDTSKPDCLYALRGSKTDVIYKVGENGTTDEVYIHENDEWQGFIKDGGIDGTAIARSIVDNTITEYSDSELTRLGPYAFYYRSKLVNVNLPNLAHTEKNTFGYCSKLRSVALPKATNIFEYTFDNCSSLQSIDFPEVHTIGNYAFANCTSLDSINLPKATSIGINAFAGCANLSSVDLPLAPALGSYAFSGCSILASISLPNVTNLGTYAFYNCYKLENINIPKVTSVGSNGFYGCLLLENIDLSHVTTLGASAFQNCSKLKRITLPEITVTNTNIFRHCFALQSVDLPKATNIATYIFNSCYSLTQIILRSSAVCTLADANALGDCYHYHGTVNSVYNPSGAKDGYIYVPRALVDSYKSAANWSSFASQFRALEDYTVDGTTTGALDESKI